MDLLKEHGLTNVGKVFRNLSTPALYEEIVTRHEGVISHLGPIVVRTGHYTGRASNDKFIVADESNVSKIWWGNINKPFSQQAFERLLLRQKAYLQDKDIFVEDCYAGANPKYRAKIRIITETAWHNLFSRNMFIRELNDQVLSTFIPDFTILHTPKFQAFPNADETNSEAFIVLNFSKKMALIGGTAYAGEIKKSVFSILNFLLPHEKVLPMHSSVNYGREKKDVAVFFGLSGTGKTTLATSSDRVLIGDDEHGWSDEGVFNFEGGCYAKAINLSSEKEPEIFETTRKFGTILENVAINLKTRRIDLNDSSLTENTRAAYPISHLKNVDISGIAGHPKNIIFLTYDGFGVIPPISRLTPEEAKFHFVLGYTSKLSGTELGFKEATPTFSPCFGAPFMPLKPILYANLLFEKIKKHDSRCWLINTGLIGGPIGIGRRISLSYSRALVSAAIFGALENAKYVKIEKLHLSIPENCESIPKDILFPRLMWEDKSLYDKKLDELSFLLEKKYEEFSTLK